MAEEVGSKTDHRRKVSNGEVEIIITFSTPLLWCFGQMQKDPGFGPGARPRGCAIIHLHVLRDLVRRGLHFWPNEMLECLLEVDLRNFHFVAGKHPHPPENIPLGCLSMLFSGTLDILPT